MAGGHFCNRFRLNDWFPGLGEAELYLPATILRNLPAKIGKRKISLHPNWITKNSGRWALLWLDSGNLLVLRFGGSGIVPSGKNSEKFVRQDRGTQDSISPKPDNEILRAGGHFSGLGEAELYLPEMIPHNLSAKNAKRRIIPLFPNRITKNFSKNLPQNPL